MNTDFVAIIPEFLDIPVVGVLVRQEEGCLNWTAIAVGSICGKDFGVNFSIFIVDGIIEGQDDHLRRVFQPQVSRNSCRIKRTKAVGKSTVV